ncbi:T9SS type A sorting domain-containing protein [Bacteroidota bacterium]
MHKLTFIFIIAVVCILDIVGQQWYPIGAEWYFNEQILLEFPAHGYSKYTVEKDTIISSKNAKIIVNKSYTFYSGNVYDIDILYLHEDSSQVYHWTGTEYKLMYDFTLEQGDTLNVDIANWHCDSVSPIVVDSIGQIEVTGTTLMVQYVSHKQYWPSDPQPYNYSDIIYERVGRIQNFLYYPVCAYDSEPWGNFRLRCYEDNDLSFRSDWWAIGNQNAPCDSLIDGSTGINLYKQDKQITLYPNPCQNIVNVEYATSLIKEVYIYNSTGQLVVACEPNDNFLQLDIKTLSSGMYYVMVYTENLIESRMLIKL